MDEAMPPGEAGAERNGHVMNDEDWRDRVLLDQAGDLTPLARQTLERELAADGTRRHFQEEAAQVVGVAREALSRGGPSAATRAAIRQAAALRVEGGKGFAGHPLQFPQRVLRLLAAAALLAVAFGLWVWAPPQRSQAVARSERLDSVSAIVALAATDEDDSEAWLAVADGGDAGGLDRLAQQLLSLQGMEMDVWSVAEEDSVVSPDGERTPTTLQWRNSPGIPWKVCG